MNQTELERTTLQSILRLWFSNRMCERGEYIVGDERLGMDQSILDASHDSAGKIPIPPMLGFQLAEVVVKYLQVPLAKSVMKYLQQLINTDKPASWFTLYLVSFLLLHGFSLQYEKMTQYAKRKGQEVFSDIFSPLASIVS